MGGPAKKLKYKTTIQMVAMIIAKDEMRREENFKIWFLDHRDITKETTAKNEPSAHQKKMNHMLSLMYEYLFKNIGVNK
jgi:1,2-phenylacetyl-CoA epoxidase PaaB subunit